MHHLCLLSLLAFCPFFVSCHQKKSADNDADTTNNSKNSIYFLAGTYTSPQGSKGIYVYRLDGESGKADSVGMVEVSNPSYINFANNEKMLYAVSENGTDNSLVHAFAFDKSNGTLTLINSQPTQGAAPCYVEADKAGRSLVTANYNGGSISVFQINDEGHVLPLSQLLNFDGSGPDEKRQERSHLHATRFSPDGRYLFATDLGADKIYRFKALDAVFEGQKSISESDMIAFDTPAGTGPRHFDFHPNGNYLYLLGELSGQIVAYRYNNGNLEEQQIVVADSLGARGSADIHVSPDGRFLYASNRNRADGIAIFAINADNGTLTKVDYQYTGIHPRNFAITPDGRFLMVACRGSNKIQVFRRDNDTGLLTDTQQDIAIDNPVCVKFAAT